MPFWYVGTLVALIAGAVLTPTVPSIAAVALVAAILLLTLTMLVPINNRIDVDRALARRWDRLHSVRLGLLIAMLISATTGVVGW
jgi:hypothetical protein